MVIVSIMTYGWRRILCTLYWTASLWWWSDQIGHGDRLILLVDKPLPPLDNILMTACDARGARLSIMQSRFREHGYLSRFMIPLTTDDTIIFLDDDMLFLYPVIRFLRQLPHNDRVVGIYGRRLHTPSYNYRHVSGECDAVLTKAVRAPARIVHSALTIGLSHAISNGEDLLLSRVGTCQTGKKPIAFDPPGIAVDVGIFDTIMRRIFGRHTEDRTRVVHTLWTQPFTDSFRSDADGCRMSPSAR